MSLGQTLALAEEQVGARLTEQGVERVLEQIEGQVEALGRSWGRSWRSPGTQYAGSAIILTGASLPEPQMRGHRSDTPYR